MNIRKQVWYFIYIILQCTWGIVQTCIGFLLFLKYDSCPHRFFYGAVHTGWNRRDGVSLGLFIFSPECEGRGEQGLLKQFGPMAVHEFGHTFQSLMLGPLYLLIVGLPSAIWANCGRYKKLREKYGVPYSFLFTEMWADSLGEKLIKRLVKVD